MIEVWRDEDKIASGAYGSCTATGDEYLVLFFGTCHIDIPRRDAERLAAFIAEVQW